MPAAPLLKSSDLIEAFKIFEQNRETLPLLVYSKYPVPIEWAFRSDNKGLMRAVEPEKLFIRSQDLQHAYYECGPFNIFGRAHLEYENPLKGDILGYILPSERAIDIDTQDDLKHAEKLYQLLK
jgi:CMP-N-acetylneuraminic acid synthetase